MTAIKQNRHKRTSNVNLPQLCSLYLRRTTAAPGTSQGQASTQLYPQHPPGNAAQTNANQFTVPVIPDAKPEPQTSEPAQGELLPRLPRNKQTPYLPFEHIVDLAVTLSALRSDLLALAAEADIRIRNRRCGAINNQTMANTLENLLHGVDLANKRIATVAQKRFDFPIKLSKDTSMNRFSEGVSAATMRTFGRQSPQMALAWHDFTVTLSTFGVISTRQLKSWTNPFEVNGRLSSYHVIN